MGYNVEASSLGVIVEYNGNVSMFDIHHVNQELGESKGHSEHLFQIRDYSKADFLDLTDSELKEIAALDSETFKSCGSMKMAIIAPEGLVRKKKVKYFEYLRLDHGTRWDVKILDTFDDAVSWISEALDQDNKKEAS